MVIRKIASLLSPRVRLLSSYPVNKYILCDLKGKIRSVFFLHPEIGPNHDVYVRLARFLHIINYFDTLTPLFTVRELKINRAGKRKMEKYNCFLAEPQEQNLEESSDYFIKQEIQY